MSAWKSYGPNRAPTYEEEYIPEVEQAFEDAKRSGDCPEQILEHLELVIAGEEAKTPMNWRLSAITRDLLHGSEIDQELPRRSIYEGFALFCVNSDEFHNGAYSSVDYTSWMDGRPKPENGLMMPANDREYVLARLTSLSLGTCLITPNEWKTAGVADRETFLPADRLTLLSFMGDKIGKIGELDEMLQVDDLQLTDEMKVTLWQSMIAEQDIETISGQAIGQHPLPDPVLRSRAKDLGLPYHPFTR